MKKLIQSTALALTLAIAPLQAFAAAETYEVDPAHTDVIWMASHMGFSKSTGKFADVSGSFTLNESSPKDSKVDITIKTGSVITGTPKFDEHLKSADFFNSAKFPEAKFVSKTVEVLGENTAKVHGDFTLLGVTKPLILDVTLNKLGENPYNKKKTVGFSAKGTIDRSLYGMTYGAPGVPNEVEIIIEAEGVLADKQ